jgi:hypothetical protein
MLKIVRTPMIPAGDTLRLEGRIIGPWVDELRRACEPGLAAGVPLALDVAEVAFMDRRGASLLKDLIDGGVAILNCPAFVSEQLKALSPC